MATGELDDAVVHDPQAGGAHEGQPHSSVVLASANEATVLSSTAVCN